MRSAILITIHKAQDRITYIRGYLFKCCLLMCTVDLWPVISFFLRSSLRRQLGSLIAYWPILETLSSLFLDGLFSIHFLAHVVAVILI